jgi:hypothetical protein
MKFFPNPEGKWPFWRPRQTGKDNIKVNKTVSEHMGATHLVQDRHKWWTPVSTVRTLWFHSLWTISEVHEQLLALQKKKILLHVTVVQPVVKTDIHAQLFHNLNAEAAWHKILFRLLPSAVEIFALLGHCTVLVVGHSHFGDKVFVPSSRMKDSKKATWPLKMEAIHWPITSVIETTLTN